MDPAGEASKSALRNALGRFVTGITVVTGRWPDGIPVGLTCNSFNSVSLDPPLILWSLAKAAYSVPAFVQGEYFAVNVLSADQLILSHRFASRSSEKFRGVDTIPGVGGVPLLKGAIAAFECRKADSREVGDHLLFIGEVLAFFSVEGEPLLYNTGKYAIPQKHPMLDDVLQYQIHNLAWSTGPG